MTCLSRLFAYSLLLGIMRRLETRFFREITQLLGWRKTKKPILKALDRFGRNVSRYAKVLLMISQGDQKPHQERLNIFLKDPK